VNVILGCWRYFDSAQYDGTPTTTTWINLQVSPFRGLGGSGLPKPLEKEVGIKLVF